MRRQSSSMNGHFTHSDFYFRALIKGESCEIDSLGVVVNRPASSTRLQISNLPPLELPTGINNFVYVRIVNVENGKKFFGTLERNQLLLEELHEMLRSVESANPKRIFDPAPGEIVLVKTAEGFVRGSIVRKKHFMTCTTYLIDCGITMEVNLEDFYVIDKRLLEIPPQAFLMLLDVDINRPALSKHELNKLIKDVIVGFRLKSISENGEAFVGEMVLRNKAGDVCDLTSILLGDIEEADYFQVDNEGINMAWPGGSLHHPIHSNEEKTQCTAISSVHLIGRKLSSEDGMNSADCVDYSEGSQNSENIQTSDAVAEETLQKEDELTERKMVLVGNSLRGMRLHAENSGPGLFYLRFLDAKDDFEDIRISSSNLLGKYDEAWYNLRAIPGLSYVIQDNTEFLHVGSIVELSVVEAYLCEQVNRGLKCRYKAAFACRLACSAPKPFNDNIYSDEAKTYFITKLMPDVYFDVNIVGISRRNILDVEIFLPGGVNLFKRMCELGFAQHRWVWKPPIYYFGSLNVQQILQRTDDEDDVNMTFVTQAESNRSTLQEFQKYLRRSERTLQNPEVGDICIVECEGQLFRAEVVDTTDKDNTFVVRYVDYGDEQELDSCSLYAVDSQEEVVLETPVFGIRCRLEGVRPAGNGLGVKGNVWSRKALTLINSVIPLNQRFRAFIGPPEADGIRPIRVLMGKGDFYDDDLNTTLVRNKLAAYKCFRNYSAPRYLSLMGNLEAKYLNVENDIIYGLPNVFEAWHLACQKYLEKVGTCTEEYCSELKGLIFFEGSYRRAFKFERERKKECEKEKCFLVDEGRTVELYKKNGQSSMISLYAPKDPQVGFFLRTCPALAVGFRFRNRKLSSQVAEYLRNVCAGKEDMHFSVCVGDTDKNGVYLIDDLKFSDGVSLMKFPSYETFPVEKHIYDSSTSKEIDGKRRSGENGESERPEYFSNEDFFEKEVNLMTV